MWYTSLHMVNLWRVSHQGDADFISVFPGALRTVPGRKGCGTEGQPERFSGEMEGMRMSEQNVSVQEEVFNGTLPDAYHLYLLDVRKYPMMTPEEEAEVAKKVKNGDPEARERMITANLRLVLSIARRYLGSGLDIEDLVSYGNIGLIKAVDKFDPERNFRFSTYAPYWIVQVIGRSIANNGQLIRLPVHMQELMRKIKKIYREAETNQEERPSVEKLAKLLDVKEERIWDVIWYVDNEPISLNKPVGEDNDGEIGGFIPAPEEENDPAKIAEKKAMMSAAVEALSVLTDRERMVIEMRYGIGGREPSTLEKIGEVLGITREGVRQMEARALKKLRKWLENGER